MVEVLTILEVGHAHIGHLRAVEVEVDQVFAFLEVAQGRIVYFGVVLQNRSPSTENALIGRSAAALEIAGISLSMLN